AHLLRLDVHDADGAADAEDDRAFAGRELRCRLRGHGDVAEQAPVRQGVPAELDLVADAGEQCERRAREGDRPGVPSVDTLATNVPMSVVRTSIETFAEANGWPSVVELPPAGTYAISFPEAATSTEAGTPLIGCGSLRPTTR